MEEPESSPQTQVPVARKVLLLTTHLLRSSFFQTGELCPSKVAFTTKSSSSNSVLSVGVWRWEKPNVKVCIL